MNQYWELFKNNAHTKHVLLLVLGCGLVIFNMTSFITELLDFIEDPSSFTAATVVIGSAFCFIWTLLGMFIVFKVFDSLEKNSQIKEAARLAGVPVVETKVFGAKNYQNYFTPVLFVINVAAIVLSFSFADMGMAFIVVILHALALTIMLPFVIIAYMGKFKMTINIIVGFLLIVPLLFYPLLFIGEVRKMF